MPFPAIVPLSTIFGGAVVAGLVQFFVTKGGMILAGLGLTFVGVTGFEAIIGYVVQDINQITSYAGSGGGASGLTGLGGIAVQVAAYVGLFDALNIVISGYMAFTSLAGVKFIVGRIK